MAHCREVLEEAFLLFIALLDEGLVTAEHFLNHTDFEMKGQSSRYPKPIAEFQKDVAYWGYGLARHSCVDVLFTFWKRY